MGALAKTGLVAFGYLAAGLVACLAVMTHEMLTASDSRGADGMFAFGDALLFFAVFGLCSLIPTVAAIRFVRQPR